MKAAFALLSISFLGLSVNACPDFSGSYLNRDNHERMDVVQHGCVSIDYTTFENEKPSLTESTIIDGKSHTELQDSDTYLYSADWTAGGTLVETTQITSPHMGNSTMIVSIQASEQGLQINIEETWSGGVTRQSLFYIKK